MENYKYLKFLIPVFILGFFVVNSNSVFAYSIETHAFLTDEIFKFYNQNFPNNKVPDEFKNYLIDGSRREDDIPRWMNHFYDPIYDRGLTDTVLGTWQKSKDWAQDGINQISALYNPVLNSTFADFYAVADPGKLRETDFSWQRAIADYVKGDKKRAFYALGHILHLIEDKAVPDHTRNDPHPGDSPYENYSQKFTLSNPDADLNKRLLNKSSVIFSDLNSYFDELAKYSNNGFYSKNRIGIQSGYSLPEPEFYPKKISGLYFAFTKNTPGDEHLLFLIKKYKDGDDLLVLSSSDISLNDPQNLVLQDYWSRLSTKSVQYGAGVINLFFQEVEKAKNDPNFIKQEEESFFGKIIGKIKNLSGQVVSTVGDFFADLFGGDNQNFQPVGQISLDQPEAVQPAPYNLEEIYSGSTGQTKTGDSTQTPAQTSSQTQTQTQIQKPDSSKNTQQSQSVEEDEELNEQQEAQKQNQQEQQQEISQTQPTQFYETESRKICSFEMGSGKTPSHQGVIINEVAWMGGLSDYGLTANDEWIELKNISGNEIDLNGWQILDIKEDIKVVFGEEDKRGIINKKISANGFYLLERTNDDSAPIITADFVYTGALSNNDEGLRLFDNQCNLIDEVLTAGSPSIWPAGDKDQKRTMERSSDFSWHTYNGAAQNNILGTPKKENSQPTVIYGGGGGGSPPNTQQPTTNNQQQTAKILINEIQISPTAERFIEFYNPNSAEINLTNWYLQRKTQTGSDFISFVSKTYFEGKTIPANGYFLISRSASADADIVISDLTLTESNTLQLKNSNQEVVDKVGWGSVSDFEGSGAAPSLIDGQSIQRKFENNTFIDTDNNASDFEIQACPSPKAQSKTCQQANQPPSAFFVYTPQEPEVNQEIFFNAASSTDPDGSIVLYEWDFGDSATSSIATATTTHIYSQAGDYTVNLIVWDNENASSTATSTTISVISVSQPVSAGVNHIVISEIMAGINGEVNNEWIELYNPTNNIIVDLTGWDLKKKSKSGNLYNLATNFASSTRSIYPKSFFLIASQQYSGNQVPDSIYTQASNHLASSENVVVLINNNGDVVDEVYFSEILAGQSIERKAWQNNACVSSQLDNEFLGNGCDTNSSDDWEIRQTPNPQNSQSLPEPRNAPTAIQDLNLSYSTSSVAINFSWSASQDASGATSTVVYEIKEYSSPGVVIFNGSSTTEFSKGVGEVGRDYNFSIEAFDKDGLGSGMTSSTISVPSFLREVYFYKASTTIFSDSPSYSSASYLLELSYDNYPILPNNQISFLAPVEWQNTNWKAMVFYLNQEASKDEFMAGTGAPENSQALSVKYNRGSRYYFLNPMRNSALILQDPGETTGGAEFRNRAIGGQEDNRIFLAIDPYSLPGEISENDYITIAYYGFFRNYPPYTAGGDKNFRIIAVDKNKYYFQNEPLGHQPPAPPSDFQFEFNGLDTLTVSFAASTDLDSLDSLLIYQMSSDEENWQPVGLISRSGPDITYTTYTQVSLNLGENYHQYFRSTDEFGLTSESVEVNWQYPSAAIQFFQDQSDSWGNLANQYSVGFQSIKPQEDFSFDKAGLKIRHDVQDIRSYNLAHLALKIYADNNNQPDLDNLLFSSQEIYTYVPTEEKETIFVFDEPVVLNQGTKYWFRVGVRYCANDDSDWCRYHARDNSWGIAISTNNTYPDGEAAQIVNNNFQILPDSDWYLKLALSGE